MLLNLFPPRNKGVNWNHKCFFGSIPYQNPLWLLVEYLKDGRSMSVRNRTMSGSFCKGSTHRSFKTNGSG